MSLLEYLLIEGFHPNGTYINAKPVEEDKEKLHNWVKDNNIPEPLDKNEYHVTITYSKHPCPGAEKHDFKLPIKAKITGWDVFDSAISPTGKCLVARLSSKQLQTINSDIKKEYGATSTFPDYKPHITVSYNHKGDAPKEWPKMNMTFNKVEVKPLDPDWRP